LTDKQAIRFLIDENVPASVWRYLQDQGHDVVHALDLFLPGEADDVLAAVADRQQALIVTWNLKDFRRITARRAPRGSRQRLRNLGWISFKCKEPRGRDRIEKVLGAIEFEHREAQRRHDSRVFVEIHGDFFKVFR